MNQTRKNYTYRIVFIGVMAAIVCVVTFFRFPLMGSKVHFANAMCLLGGLLFGPLSGGLSAGIGSALYDGLFGGYGILDILVTFITKFATGWLAGVLSRLGGHKGENHILNVLASIVGALGYVALYMLKTLLFQRFLYQAEWGTVFATMASKLPASMINAVFAMIVAPILYAAIRPMLQKAGVLEKI